MRLEIKDLRVFYGKIEAIKGISVVVNQGEIVTLIGANGAGKTTTLRCILGLLTPDSGSVTILGMDARSDAVQLHKRLAYVPGDVALWPTLTGGEVTFASHRDFDAQLPQHSVRKATVGTARAADGGRASPQHRLGWVRIRPRI